MSIRIRPYEPVDEEAVAAVWHRAGRAAYPYLPAWQSLAREEARFHFRNAILAACDVWIAERDSRIVAYLAIKGSYVDRLYVDPDEQRCGWGTRLLDHAKTLSPDGLELDTHQENQPARAFYERHGFEAVRFGVSPPPESAPDVGYEWRPADAGER